ncbi:hypothetical protein UCREL1_7530 [Eutypa lata UCREL1]|uniref:Uncharacterized protein n=1 Tax=Eutypa lata (strain UCR-EL1) TaxID=1287681 RepID=M7T6P8_EUTLA|nr:hypothetical protein UCREL1_7530 [Eutypa lata UCREL1]
MAGPKGSKKNKQQPRDSRGAFIPKTAIGTDNLPSGAMASVPGSAPADPAEAHVPGSVPTGTAEAHVPEAHIPGSVPTGTAEAHIPGSVPTGTAEVFSTTTVNTDRNPSSSLDGTFSANFEVPDESRSLPSGSHVKRKNSFESYDVDFPDDYNPDAYRAKKRVHTPRQSRQEVIDDGDLDDDFNGDDSVSNTLIPRARKRSASFTNSGRFSETIRISPEEAHLYPVPFERHNIQAAAAAAHLRNESVLVSADPSHHVLSHWALRRITDLKVSSVLVTMLADPALKVKWNLDPVLIIQKGTGNQQYKEVKLHNSASSNHEAVYGAMVGTVRHPSHMCDSCSKKNGPFGDRCIVVPGYFHGSCVNCHYGNGGSKCSLRPDAQKRTKKGGKSVTTPLNQGSPVQKFSSQSHPASSGSRRARQSGRSLSAEKPPSRRVIRRVLNHLLDTISDSEDDNSQ